MEENLSAHCEINSGHFLLGLTLFVTGASLWLIYMPGRYPDIGFEAYLALSALIIMLDAVFSVSVLGAAVLPAMSALLGVMCAQEMTYALSAGDVKSTALLVCITAPLHLCLSAYGMEYSLCLRRLQKRSGLPKAQICRRLYVLTAVALLASCSAFAAMILNR